MGRIDQRKIAEERNVDPDETKSFWIKVKDYVSNLATWKKIVALVVIVALLGLGVAACVLWDYAEDAVEVMHVETPEDYDLSLVDVDGYINLLALGVDSRDMSNIKGTRSDMIMIASINIYTYEVTLTSVYRDTYTKIGDTGTYDKITHACAYGGPDLTMKTLNQMLDINISNYVVVNFKAVADLVDAVGGIEVDVQEKEINQLNKYTKQTAKNIGKEDYNLVKSAGLQRLEGVQAVSYGRIRKGVGDDIKRTERMRTVVSLTLEKLKTMSFSEIKDIISMMLPQIQTNLEMSDILGLGIRLPQYNITSGKSYPYNWTCGTINKISYLFSTNYTYDTKLFHQEAFGQTEYIPSALVQEISSGVANRLAEAKANQEIEITDEQTYEPEELGMPIYDSDGNIIGYEAVTPANVITNSDIIENEEVPASTGDTPSSEGLQPEAPVNEPTETDPNIQTDTGDGTQVTQDSASGAGETNPEE